MSPSIVEGLELRDDATKPQPAASDDNAEPSLCDPALGNPISHSQILDLARDLAARNSATKLTLEKLLQGARVYVPPPPPKVQPSSEYIALMARLRREEEERAYERMLNPAPPLQSFSQRFPSAAARAHLYAEVNRPTHAADMGDDDVTLNDVHRQMMLILNFTLSILGVAATLWVVARWWSTPARLFLTLGGSILVGIAEVVVYSGYIWHLGEADKKEKGKREHKEVVKTWVVEKDMAADQVDKATEEPKDTSVRRRKGAAT